MFEHINFSFSWFSSDRRNSYRENFFKDVGEIVDVRFAVNHEDNRFKGFGHVEFATAEEAKKVSIGYLSWLFKLDFPRINK